MNDYKSHDSSMHGVGFLDQSSSAAAPRDNPLGRETKVALDKAKQEIWYNSGVRAKQRGYGDLSPYYENATADYFFKCGYDNVPFVEAQQVLQTKIKDLLETAPEVKEVLDELQPQKS